MYQEGNVLLDNQDEYELKAATAAVLFTSSSSSSGRNQKAPARGNTRSGGRQSSQRNQSS